MLTELITILATAALSSALTLTAAYLLFRHRLRTRLEEAFEEKLAEAESRLGVLIEDRVRRGVVQGVAAIPSSEVLKSTTRSAARTGAELVEEGLASLLGGGRRGKPR